MRCFDDNELLDLTEGHRALDAEAEAHLVDCPPCRMLLAAAARGAGVLVADASCAPPLATEPSWNELGQGVVVASRFELERFLGCGATGVVWSARLLAAGSGNARRVALKIGRTTEPELRRRLEREARIAASLSHPNVVRIFEVLAATEERGPILVQELLEGETLEALLQRVLTLPLSSVARLVLPIAHALGAAHQRGIVHRDLKPQNVYLTADRVVVLDFGIAKLLPRWGAHSVLTRPGAVLGTPRYMAPEQLFGDADVDPRADVWALGALTFRALVGRPPVDGDTIGQVMKNLARGHAHRLATEAPELPGLVCDVVDAALTIPRELRTVQLASFFEIFARWAR